jgi:hypothetical protein
VEGELKIKKARGLPLLLALVVATSTIVPTSGGGLGSGRLGGGVEVASLSATAHTQELGVKIVVAHITRAVRRVGITERRIAVQHLNYLTYLFFVP